MSQVLKMRPSPDELDTLVDGVLANPARADDLKREFRTRFRAVEQAADESADELDLWENVPV